MILLFAYVDPGSGLMVVQILSAAFCGAVFSLKKVRGWIAQLFRRSKPNERK